MRSSFYVIVSLAVMVHAPRAARADSRDATPAVVETTRGLNVYTVPGARRARSRGRVLKGARFRVLERSGGRGCKGTWLRIDDRAWLCSRHTRPSSQPPGGKQLPILPGDSELPYSYVVTHNAKAYRTLADATAKTNPVSLPGDGGFRFRGARRFKGARYLRTDEGWILAKHAKLVHSIGFSGQPLPADAVGKRLAFTGSKRVRLYDRAGTFSGEWLDAQTYLGEVSAPVHRRGGRALVAISAAGDRFARQRDLALLTWATPPSTTTITSDERWLDIDLTQQVMVAYQGATPTFATLVSTARTATPVGEFRIEKKRPYSRMRSKPHYRHKWDILAPWVISIKGRIAFHAAYWHRDFGRARSQGCVNLAPKDAKWVWDWTHPALPAGWLRIESDDKDRATLVRIRRSTP